MKSLLFVVALLGSLFAFSQTPKLPKPSQSGYAPVNGQKIYYEIYGQGKPVVLLHGAFMTIGLNWSELIPELSKTRKVIALEMQGHGHTQLTDRALSFDSLADDVAKVCAYLKVDSTDLIGYSFGGTIAYKTVMDHPKLIRRMVIISSTYKYDGWQKETREVLKTMKPEFFTNTPLKVAYDKVAPDPSKWTPFLTRMIAFDNAGYDLGDDKIDAIKQPVLIISGDNDGVDKQVLMDTYTKLGGNIFADMTGVPASQLAIVPGQGHVSLMMQTDLLARFINAFLK